jgi:hypothetical protein
MVDHSAGQDGSGGRVSDKILNVPDSCELRRLDMARRVESRGSLRFSPIETPSCPIRGDLAIFLPRQFARFPYLSTRHFLSNELSCEGLYLLALRGVELLDNVVHVLGHTLLSSLA